MVHVGHGAYCMLGFVLALGRAYCSVFSIILFPKLSSLYPTPYSPSYRQAAEQALILVHSHKIGSAPHHHGGGGASTAKGRLVIYQKTGLRKDFKSMFQIIEAFGGLRVALRDAEMRACARLPQPRVSSLEMSQHSAHYSVLQEEVPSDPQGIFRV